VNPTDRLLELPADHMLTPMNRLVRCCWPGCAWATAKMTANLLDTADVAGQPWNRQGKNRTPTDVDRLPWTPDLRSSKPLWALLIQALAVFRMPGGSTLAPPH
jgi:hypothetical protein